MKRKSRIISVLLSISMLISMLPAHIAQAASTEAQCKRFGSLSDLQSSDFNGTVLKLEKTSDEEKDEISQKGGDVYKLSVGLYNTDAVATYQKFKFDSTVFTMVGQYTNKKKLSWRSIDDVTKYREALSNSSEYLTGFMLTDKGKEYYARDYDADSDTYSEIIGTLMDGSFNNGKTFVTDPSDSKYIDFEGGFFTNSASADSGEATPLGNGYFNEKETKKDTSTITYYSWKTPANKVAYIFSLYFELNANKTAEDITADTFGLVQDFEFDGKGNAVYYWGALSSSVDSAGKNDSSSFSDEGVYMIGDIFEKFKSDEPEATPTVSTVTFNVTQSGTSTAIPNASVVLKQEGAADITGTTDQSGYLRLTDVPYGNYTYTVSYDGYSPATQDVTIDSTTHNYNVSLTLSSDTAYSVRITVRNADTEVWMNDSTGAEVKEGAISKGSTAGRGYVDVSAKAGPHTYTASRDGFTAKNGSINVDSDNTDLEISLVPNRATITLPTVTDGDNNALTDAKVTVTKMSDNKTKAWNDGNSSEEGNQGDDMTVPADTDYSITTHLAGYTDATVYAHVKLNDDGTTEITYYSDAAHSNPISAEKAETLTSTRVADPYYRVDIARVGSNSSNYKATVRLNNLSNGTYGTFGLKYNTELFTKSSFTLTNSELKIMKPEDPDLQGELDNTEVGYHVFTWESRNRTTGITAKTIDGVEGVVIAEYVFVLNPGVSADDIPIDAFTVIPYDTTAEAKSYAEKNPTNSMFDPYRDVFRLYFRYHKDDTSDPDYTKGIYADASNAIINGADVGGFYQAYGMCDVREEDGSELHDAITYINFDAKKSGLTFMVTDETSGDPIKDATVKLYKKTGDDEYTYADDITTDAVGMASYAVEIEDGEDVVYKYVVSASGYWDCPDPEDSSAVRTVTVSAGKSTRENVALERKIYHTPELQDGEGAAIAAEKATLGGDPLAYYGRDYHFTIEPATGQKIKDGDLTVDNVEVYALIGDDEETATPTKINGVTLDSETGVFTVPRGDNNITKTPVAATIDENGFKSNKIIVKFLGAFEDDNTEYIVDALTNEGGKITYTKTAGNEWPATTTAADNRKIVVDKINPNKAESPVEGTNTGTFKFEPVTEGWKVDRVYINGVQVHQFDDQSTVEFSFGSVDMDNNITVLFYDGTTRSTDKVVTLVVGDYGKVAVSGTTDTDVRNTRRVYLNPSSVTITATADSGYTETVQRQVGTVARQAVENTGVEHTYSITPDTTDAVTAYVSFAKNEEDATTPTVFVRAYVVQPESGKSPGDSKIAPTGILIFNKQASPTFKMTADIAKSWKLTGVKISELDKISEGETEKITTSEAVYDYTYENLQKDIAIGAIFEETPATVTGFIDLGQYLALSNKDYIASGAVVTFIRVNEGVEDITDTCVGQSLATRHGSKFSVPVPSGTWNVVVSKPGYLSYKIEGFTIEPGEDSKVFNEENKPIVPIIGNASANGKVIALTDAATIRSGLRTGMNEKVQSMADVDDDGRPDADVDLQYVMTNYGKRAIVMTYSEFKALPALGDKPWEGN